MDNQSTHSHVNGGSHNHNHNYNHSHGHEGHSHSPSQEESSAAESVHHDHVLRAFSAYRYAHLAANNLRRQSYITLSENHKALLPNQPALLNTIDHCIVANAELLEDTAAAARSTSLLLHNNHTSNQITQDRTQPKPKITENELDKTRSTLRQLHRDWSEEGRVEREKAYIPILEALDAAFSGVRDKSKLRILVPGCGLGRLPFEIAARGYSCQGNEFSLYMLFTASYILNNTTTKEEFPIYPFCHSLSNIGTSSGATREIRVPDILPTSLGDGANLSMAAGDFLDIYKDEAGNWDAVVTCFFIDTAHNIIEYLELIKSLLKPGGVWINLGPSLWHFEGMTSGSIDIPMDELKQLVQRIGFKIENEREIEMTYTSNPASCLKYTYQASFWTATVAE